VNCFNGIYKTYRIIIYYESDQGPLPLDPAVSNMLETGYSDTTNQILNIEAEQHVLLDDGTFVNTGSEMCRIENEKRRAEIHTFQREHSINNHNRSEIIPRLTPLVPSISEKSVEPTTKLADSNFFLNDPCQSRKIDIKQTSILEFIG
jgi:hypothetical protein